MPTKETLMSTMIMGNTFFTCGKMVEKIVLAKILSQFPKLVA
jgi:hypothetical protein